MLSDPMRVTGITVSRAIENAGGLWNQERIALIVGIAHQSVRDWIEQDTFPRAVLILGNRRAWAGEDILDWLESKQKFYAAEKMFEAVQKEKLRIRQLAVTSTGGTHDPGTSSDAAHERAGKSKPQAQRGS